LTVLLIIVHALVRPARDVAAPTLRRALTVRAVEALHQRITIDWRVLVPALLALLLMLAAWTATRAPPHLVAWLGALVALALVGARARGAVLRGVDVEATLFLFGLFVLVGAVRESGLFASLATGLAALPIGDELRLLLLIIATGVATGLFSAGPSMAAMMEVAGPLAHTVTPAAVYVGLAFGVCAGSSLLLTAATSGPLAQSLVERAAIVDDQGRRVRFTFQAFLPVGALSFCVILACGLVAAVWIAG
jgi:Na+/H+ antiporter NhaD/arsenite permease-like protein